MPYDSDVDSQRNTSQNQILLLLKLTLMSGLGMQRLLASGVFQFHGANIDGTSTGFHTFMCYRVKSIKTPGSADICENHVHSVLRKS
jgi:hypothetical protein